jgi:hypothetical protein
VTDSTPPPPPDEPSGGAELGHSSHRGRRKASSVVLPLVFALALVLVGFLAMWGWITLSGDDGGKGGVASPTTPAPTSTSASPSPTTSSPTGSPSSSTTSSSSSPSPSASSKSPTSKSPTAEPDRSATVVVFNQTGVSGLAAAYAARLQQLGWRITGVDNWTGTVPETTVYYRPGDEAAARQLMRDLPQVNRMRAAVTGMPEQGLTLILAGNAPAV